MANVVANVVVIMTWLGDPHPLLFVPLSVEGWLQTPSPYWLCALFPAIPGKPSKVARAAKAVAVAVAGTKKKQCSAEEGRGGGNSPQPPPLTPAALAINLE